MFFAKQYGFQVNNSTHHASLNLNDDILTSFEKGPKQNIIYFILQEKEKIYQISYLHCTLTTFQSKENLSQSFSEYT